MSSELAVVLPDGIAIFADVCACWEGLNYRRVRIKRPGFGDIRTPLNRGMGARCVLRLLRHVHVVSAQPFSKQQALR